ncbi:TrkH-domain-containing protein [Amylocystis lapponica]|nr:TrkH-domain-containing protein [Amylocystis lapponica]
MSSLPAGRLSGHWIKSVGSYALSHLNFFRIHIIFFTFTPLIFSGILYAVNGEFPVSYIDCLFNCISAMTVCGLATVDLSGLTPFQQVLLFIQMCLGSPVTVSWVMVYIRRNFFAKKFQHAMESRAASRFSSKVGEPVEVKFIPWWRRALELMKPGKDLDATAVGDSDDVVPPEHNRSQPSRLRPDMIRRMDDAPKLVNPSGWISEGHTEAPAKERVVDRSPAPITKPPRRQLTFTEVDTDASSTPSPSESESSSDNVIGDLQRSRPDMGNRRVSDAGGSSQTVTAGRRPVLRTQTMNTTSPTTGFMPRTQTVEFTTPPHPLREVSPERDRGGDLERDRNLWEYSLNDATAAAAADFMSYQDTRSMRRPTMSVPYSTASRRTHKSARRTMHQNFGGFPMPDKIISKLFRRFFPKLQRKLTRTVTIPRTRTIASQHGNVAPGAKGVSYITFEATVGRNSVFKRLTHEQLEELGGVEYRALTALLWIVGGYHILSQLLSFVVIAPYISIPRWREDFQTPALHRNVSPVWFSGFQVVSSYTNTGMSLVDQSMVPFQTAYPMILLMIFLILAGNTAFPVFLRFTIWVISKVVPQKSRVNETLHFLLDHPRRCFVYLFPSHQTWFLLTVLIALNGTDWFFFLVLDIGNSAITIIPSGVRVLLGILQAVAVRASGFGSVTLSALAPAVKVLYVVMMYVSVYPIAMSVRSTNVYEEKSLGVFDEEEESDDEEDFNPTGNRVTVWSRYLAMHMRKQLSFDMWWLGMALFLVCIIERDNLEDDEKATWFNIFTILFELVSAYGTVGLSLGLPYANYSFSGALRPLSKLILCAVMLRGRHRGLPVAIDRAVMLPWEFQDLKQQEQQQQQQPSPAQQNDAASMRRPSVNGLNGDPSEYSEKAPQHTHHRRRSSMKPPTVYEPPSELQQRIPRFLDEETVDS